MKKWMIVNKGRNYILLHYNEELEQYKKFPRVPNWIIKKIKNKRKKC
jgi:hypothetical protein